MHVPRRPGVTNFDTAGATSLLTTVEDLALWDENFYNPRVGGTGAQRERRDLLRRAMEKEGFEVYPDEWRHFDDKDWKHDRILDTPFKGIAAGIIKKST